ncbi:AraC family transcriptional regulator [Flavobacterium hauense]
MNKEHLYQPFEIIYKTLDECPKEGHKHMFFELVYIISGTGTQCINDNKFKYHAGHMFLITPEDCHSFDIETTTEFFFLRFNDIYIKSKAFHSEDVERLEYILNNANHQPGCILKNLSDKTLVKAVTEAIIREYVNRDLYNKELIQQLVNTLIVVVARNIAKYLPEMVDEKTEEKAMDIINYIQKNIYFPEQLRTGVMSSVFGISDKYLGKYFKKHTNETIQQYIGNHRMKLIEARLKFSDKRITEIAEEFGFTDESHFTKFFRKNNGINPTQYRKQLLQTVATA